MNEPHYWYDNRHELEPGQIFRTVDGSLVKLDRSVPGDGTKWYVAHWMDGWFYEDGTIEPGDLMGNFLSEPALKSVCQNCDNWTRRTSLRGDCAEPKAEKNSPSTVQDYGCRFFTKA